MPTDSKGRVLDAALDELLRTQEPGTPSIVLLQAGDFHTGAFDDFRSLIPIAKRYGAWVHIDGAFGLWAQQVRPIRISREALMPQIRGRWMGTSG